MATTVTIDLRQVARGLDVPLRQIQAVVELLDEGNTVPFITRYRKDQTGGLDEEQIREIQARLARMRLLADRKQTILRSIESQGKLTEKIAKQILAASTAKRLEDLYLPFKPKKQTLATLARSRGLEPLAREILEAAPSCLDLDARAADFVNPDRQVPTAADALLGAGHILAEQFSEQAELRQQLREVLQRTGLLVSSRVPAEEKAGSTAESKPNAEKAKPAEESAEQPAAQSATPVEQSAASVEPRAEAGAEDQPVPAASESESTSTHEANTRENATLELPAESAPVTDEQVAASESSTSIEPSGEAISQEIAPQDATSLQQNETSTENTPPVGEETATTGEAATETTPVPKAPVVLSTAAQRKLARQQAKQAAQKKREEQKKKLEEKKIKDFQDYFDYREEIKKIPPHRVLAINRGERAKILRVKVECDQQAMTGVLEETLVPAEHPHIDYLRGCARDSLGRLIMPSLEREVRRELTDHAETHAVGVFAKNLRNLLLQAPVHNHRLLAVDPGFRSGCKLAALDQFGNLIEHGVIFLVGKPDRRDEAKQKVLDLIQRLELSVIVIGNGTACRHTEDFFAELVEKDLKEQGVAYVIVNEAGASVYSTSRIGREEFPEYDATLRGAISIGRRLLDPLSELVKIDPANIGVGLYQHDVKAKHLSTSLDEVVESCVNYVGVDVNTASPALLRYVSGLNQLTARRLFEYRSEHGPFRSREQLRQVPGLGEATFVQAAGFLKILNGDDPLDATWIHPESYEVANRVLEKVQGAAADLRDKETVTALGEKVTQVDLDGLAGELQVGVLTLKDIVAQLARPGRDPREDLPAPIFKRGVIKLEDLEPGMELTGTVLNVVDFGCFVDIGMHQSGLVHVSRLADKFVRDPHDVVAVGDIVKVWVMEVDKERHRVSLTMVRPGSERPKPPHHGGRPAQGKPEGGEGRPPQGENRPRQQRPPRPGQQQRPPRPGGEGRPPRPQGQQGRGRPQYEHRPPARPPRPAPKPLIPITEAMKAGKEPMRTFGDLLQFYQKKEEPPEQKQPPVAVAEPASPAPAIAASQDETPRSAEGTSSVAAPAVQEPVLDAPAVETAAELREPEAE